MTQEMRAPPTQEWAQMASDAVEAAVFDQRSRQPIEKRIENHFRLKGHTVVVVIKETYQGALAGWHFEIITTAGTFDMMVTR